MLILEQNFEAKYGGPPNTEVNYVSIEDILDNFDIDASGELGQPDLVYLTEGDVLRNQAERLRQRIAGSATSQLNGYLAALNLYKPGFFHAGISYDPPSVIPPPPLYGSLVTISANRPAPGVILYVVRDISSGKPSLVTVAAAGTAFSALVSQIASSAATAENAAVLGDVVLGIAEGI